MRWPTWVETHFSECPEHQLQHKSICLESLGIRAAVYHVGPVAGGVAQWVTQPGLRSLQRDATELTRVQFPVAALKVGKNPSRAIYEANTELRLQFGKSRRK